MILSSELRISTEQAERIIKKLNNHWRHKLNIEQHEQLSTIHFSNQVIAFLTATPEQLIAKVQALDTEQLHQYQDVVLSHLNRMAQQEFAADWKRLN